MGYYGMKGDFYGSGGYYMGDPGFFSSIARGIGGFVKGALGMPVASAVPRALPAAGGTLATRGVAAARAAGGAIVTTVKQHPVLTAAGAAGAIGAMAGAGGEALMRAPGAVGVRGYHMSKAYRRYGVYPKPPHPVKNRRMRVTNPRALRRAIRRATGFARLARRVLHFTSPRAPRGRALFKRRRKR